MITFCRKLLACVLLIFFLLISGASPVWAQSVSPRVVRIGIYDNKPKIYRDEEGRATGLYGDILEFIAAQENWQLVFVHGTFDEGLNRLKAGQIDIMVDVAYSDERAKEYDFNVETVFGSWGVVYVRKESTINSFDALDGKKVALLRSSIYRTGADSIDRYNRAFDLNIKFVETEEYAQVFDLLSKGEVDAAIVSRISGLEAEKTYPNIKATDVIFKPTELRFALTKNDLDNAYLIDRLDFWIKRLHEGYQEIYPKILQKHGLSRVTERVMVIPPWVYPAVAIAFIAVIVAWILVIGLRRARGIALQLLAKKEWYLGKVLNNMPVIFTVLDGKGMIVFSEGKGLQNLDLKPGEVVGQSGFSVFRGNEIIDKNLRRALAGEELQFEVELKGGVYKSFAYPVMENGKLVEVAIISVDSTDESLLNKAKKEFIYIVQHQLRTPPTVISWGMELLSPKVIPILNKEEKKNWRMVEEANIRMISLANTISRISEMESGLFPIKLEQFDLPEQIKEILSELGKTINDRKIKVTTDFDNVASVSMDKAMMEIIIQTLISNAIHYSFEKATIKISTEAKEESWILKVEDKGIGIPNDLKDKIFVPFYRGQDAAKYYPEGIGMGLYTTKTLLTSIRGRIWYESRVGKGSTFYVEIPTKVSLMDHSSQ